MADINDLKDICISSGTLRAEDLLPRFMGILKDYAPEKFNEFIKGYPELDGWEEFLREDWRLVSDDTKMDACDELFGLLNDIAPEGTMFSSTEGDGADFGFWTVEEKLLDDDEGEKALKQMAKDGKSTGEVAADIRYDVATALDMAADKAEDMMTKFGLDKIYVLRAQGLSPKAIAKKIQKACESKYEGWLGGFYSRQDVLDAMDGGILNKDWKLEKRFGNWGCYVNQNTGRPLVLQVSVSQDRSGDWGYKPVTSDMGPVDTNIQAAKWLKPRLEEWVEKNPDLAKDVPDYEWGWIEKCLGKETANKDRKNLVSSLVKGDKIKLIDTVADGAVVTFIDMITPTKMRILHNGREMSCKTSFIDRKVEESKDERRDSADYLQEVWDALVSVWDKDKFDMAKGYDDEYECEAITITVKDNEGVRAKIYVDDHEGKHPVGFDVIYRYPGDKGVGDQGYYEFQSTDFDEVAPEIFAYFDELKGKIKAESKVDDSENILLFQTAKGSEAYDAHDALEKLYLDNMDNTVDVVAIRMEDDGDDYYRVYATGKRSAVSKFLELYAQNFGKDAFTDSLDSMWTEPRYFKDLLITESKGDNWVAYYFCKDPQGLEWAVLPHAINGIGNARCVNARGGDDSIAIEYVLDECTPIKDVKGSDIYGKVKELEDRDIVALTRDEAERIALADDRLKELKAIVSLKDESMNEDLNTAKDFVYSIAPIGILVRQAGQPGFKGVKNSDDHIIVGFMRHDNTRFIIDWDADKKQGTATRQVPVDDKDALYGYKWVTPKSNANVTFTTREELKDFVEGSWDNTSSESKNESLPTKEEIKRVVDGLRKDKDFSRRYTVSDAALYGELNPEWAPVVIIRDKKTGNDYATIAFDGDSMVRIINDNPYSPFEGDSYDVEWMLSILKKGNDPSTFRKSESLTLKQKELKDMARYGEAEDITTISDAEAKELKKKGIETVGVSRGTYGMNGALLRDREGNKYVITARSSNLFYFV